MSAFHYEVKIEKVDNGWVVYAYHETKIFRDPDEMLTYVYDKCRERGPYDREKKKAIVVSAGEEEA